MAGCLDRCFCMVPESLSIPLREKRNGIASCVASLLFTSGWWIMIDAAVKVWF